MKAEKHENLSELVADLRNKMGSIVSYFSLLKEKGKIDYSNTKMKQMLQNLIDKNEKTAIENITIVKNLLDQFENFDLK